MIGNSVFDYLNIRICISALRLVAPASILYLACCAINPRYFVLPVALYTASEASFYLFVYLPRRSRLQLPSSNLPPRLTREQRQLLFHKCLELGAQDTTVSSTYPASWFLPINSKPKREDIVDWLLFSLFSTSREEVDIGQYTEELNEYLDAIERKTGAAIEDGYSRDQGVRSMRISLDPVAMLHRPLLWYFIIAVVDTYTSVLLLSMGFKHFVPSDPQWSRSFPPRVVLFFFSRRAPEGVVFPYWHRAHESSTKLPLVFLHGIGIGLYPYVPFLRNIVKGDRDAGILLPEFLAICSRITPRSVPPRSLTLASLNVLLESLTGTSSSPSITGEQQPLLSTTSDHNNRQHTCPAWDRVVLAGNSFGTVIIGWTLRQIIDGDTEESTDHSIVSSLGSKIAHMVLVDPIPIFISNSTVAHNFLYRKPSTVCPRQLGSIPDVEVEVGFQASPATPRYYSSAAAWQLWYFSSRDADIARTLCRSFFWTECVVWREDIEVFLSGNFSVDGPAPVTGGLDSTKFRNMAVVLGGMDQVVPAEAVRRYLTGEKKWKERWLGGIHQDVGQVQVTCGNLEVLFNPHLDHAVIFDKEKWAIPLLDVVQRYIRDVDNTSDRIHAVLN